jgi:hypothetical protein
MPPGSPDSSRFLDYLDDPSIKWHALQPMDLGFLEKTLSDGLPASYKRPSGWWSLCISGSPGTSIRDGHGFTSFLAYTMEPSRLSIAIRTDKTDRPGPDRLWFVDEYLTTQSIPPAEIVAVAVNNQTLAAPLSKVELNPQAMEFDRQFDYLQSSIDWAGRVCGQATADKLQQRFLPPLLPGAHRLRRVSQETAGKQMGILREVASHLHAELGREPTVADAIDRTIRLAGSSATLLVWDDQTKRVLQDINSQVPQHQPNMHSIKELAQDPRRRPPSSAHSEQVSSSSRVGGGLQPGTASAATQSARHTATTVAASIRSVTTAGNNGQADAPSGPAVAPGTGRDLSWRRIRSLVSRSAAARPTTASPPGQTPSTSPPSGQTR